MNRNVFSRLMAIAMMMAVNASMMPLLAQTSDLVGMWQAKNGQLISTNMGKIYLPNGKMYGYNLVPGYTDSISTWIMGDYKVTNPGQQYVEYIDFHTSINYQLNLKMNYKLEDNGNTLVTEYVNILPNGQSQVVKEQWQRKELTKGRIAYLTNNWESLLAQARKSNGRMPADGQTIASAADSLKAISDNYKQAKNLDAVIYFLMVRAELDSTKLDWQNDVMSFFHEVNAAPSYANKYADRIVRLSEAQAASPADSIVINAYESLAINYMRQNNASAAHKALDHALELVEQAGEQQRNVGLWSLKATAFLREGKIEEMGNYVQQILNQVKQSQKFTKEQIADIYYLGVMANFIQERWDETLEYAEQTLPLFEGQPNKQSEIRSVMYKVYTVLLQKKPGDKKLIKAYQSFMENNMVCAKFQSASSNPWGLEGLYYILETDDWNMDSSLPNDVTKDHNRMLLIKDGSISSITKKEGENWQAELSIVPVSKGWKNNIRKEWKEYKKKNK